MRKKKDCPFCRKEVAKIVEFKQVDFTGDSLIDKYAKIKEYEP